MEDPAGEFAFTRLWMQAQGTVAGFIAAAVPDRHACEDLVQEVALACFRRFAHYDPQRPFVAWALGVARHKVWSRWRTLSRTPALVRDEQLLADLAEVSAGLEEECDRRATALRTCLRQVDGRAWELLRRQYHDEQTPARIADDLGLRQGHVRVLLSRIRAALRACIERQVAGGGG